MPIKIKHRSCYFGRETQGGQYSVFHPTSRSTYPIFVSNNLATCSHVFLHIDSLRKGLQPPYWCPYKVVDHTEKVFRILRHGKEVSVSIHTLKSAYIPKVSDLAVEVNLKEKVSLEPEEIQESEQEKLRESCETRNHNPFWPRETLLTASIAKDSLSLVGATCSSCEMLTSLDDIGRGDEATKEEVKRDRHV
ncbi:hypothetical protein TNIN_365501 [Trichonephila inaurata madagascariensis]|uniref:Uncharacterized protein n=1 Tax=Trichonephila inaurata madagascariensis TaxID=2747483 RepID=A0A8X7BT03_9ARAC|nr:hypothetical protein TNIN_365501 [Trichonephila inaurata madagascariensis]